MPGSLSHLAATVFASSTRASAHEPPPSPAHLSRMFRPLGPPGPDAGAIYVDTWEHTVSNDGRSLIDPEDRYPTEGLRSVEALALRALRCLPGARLERTRDAIQIEEGGDKGVVVLVTPEALEIRLPTVEWTSGAYGPAMSSRLWKRLRAKKIGAGAEELTAILQQARRARSREFKRCRYCKELFPVEHRHGNACHGCAQRFEGVVH